MDASLEQLSEDLFRFMERIKHGVNDLAEANGLTHVQLFVLHTIEKHGELAMGQTATALHCDASNVTGLVDRLVAQGLVERRECTTDRRTKTLHVTSKGRQIIEDVRVALPEYLGWDRLDTEERLVMRRAIRKFVSEG